MGKMLEKLKQVEEKKTGEAKVSPFGMMLKTAVNKAAKSAKGSGRVSMNDDDAAFFLFENMELASVKYWVKTGFVGLDWILSSGRGFPMGRAVEIWGMEATAKSALAQYIAARFQHKYSQGHVVYADAENSLDADHLKGYGIDPYRFIPLYPVHLEAGMDSLSSALECCTKPKKSKDPKPDPVMFIMDSVAQFPPRAEVVEDNSTDSHVGLQARIMSKGCRKLVRPLAERKMGVIFLNQVRTKIGVQYGDPTIRPCGHALDFACSVILKTTRFKTLTRTKGGEKVRWGYLIQVKSTKSRLAPPHRETEIVVSFKKGPDPVETALHLAKKAHLIKPAGSEGFKWPGIVTGSFKPSKFSEIWDKEKDKINEALLAALESGATLSDDAGDSDDDGE